MALRANKLHRFAALGEHPVERATEYFPEARWQRCMVHFYRNVFSRVPAGKLPEVALMLKVIYAQEDFQAAQRKAAEVVARLLSMRLGKAAELVETAVPETLAYYAFPDSRKSIGGALGPTIHLSA